MPSIRHIYLREDKEILKAVDSAQFENEVSSAYLILSGFVLCGKLRVTTATVKYSGARRSSTRKEPGKEDGLISSVRVGKVRGHR